MPKRQESTVSSHLRKGCLLLTTLLIFLPSMASAEPSLFLSLMEELESLDLKALRDLKLSAKLSTDKKGIIVFQSLNFSTPVADNPFEGMGIGIRFNQFEIKSIKRGVVARIAFSF
jgi:hypothetical protein